MSDGQGHGLSASELELLTEEERAGLESGEFDDEDGDDGDDGDGNGDGGAGDAGSGDAGAAGAGDDGAGGGEDDGDDDDDAAPQPLRAAERIDAAQTQTRIDAIGTEQAELEAKLDDGEITTKEFIEANKKLEAEQHKLTGALERQTAADEAVTEKWFHRRWQVPRAQPGAERQSDPLAIVRCRGAPRHGRPGERRAV